MSESEKFINASCQNSVKNGRCHADCTLLGRGADALKKGVGNLFAPYRGRNPQNLDKRVSESKTPISRDPRKGCSESKIPNPLVPILGISAPVLRGKRIPNAKTEVRIATPSPPPEALHDCFQTYQPSLDKARGTQGARASYEEELPLFMSIERPLQSSSVLVIEKQFLGKKRACSCVVAEHFFWRVLLGHSWGLGEGRGGCPWHDTFAGHEGQSVFFHHVWFLRCSPCYFTLSRICISIVPSLPGERLETADPAFFLFVPSFLKKRISTRNRRIWRLLWKQYCFCSLTARFSWEFRCGLPFPEDMLLIQTEANRNWDNHFMIIQCQEP